MASFSKTFDFNLRRDHQKNFLWASRLWVGRRKEPILGYVPKNDEKKNSGGKGLKEFYQNIWTKISNLKEFYQNIWTKISNLKEFYQNIWIKISNLKEFYQNIWIKISNLKEFYQNV